MDIILDTRGVKAGRLAALLLGVLAVFAVPAGASACSPSFNPTIRELGPAQIVVVGRVGEKVPGGRLFHVERWFNGGDPVTPIVIGFKEGEPIGDCSYPVAMGEHKIIAPLLEADGTLYADLGTLQADPDSVEGRKYVAEAIALFGQGVVLLPTVAPEPAGDGIPSWLAFAAAFTAGLVAVHLLRRRRSSANGGVGSV